MSFFDNYLTFIHIANYMVHQIRPTNLFIYSFFSHLFIYLIVNYIIIKNIDLLPFLIDLNIFHRNLYLFFCLNIYQFIFIKVIILIFHFEFIFQFFFITIHVFILTDTSYLKIIIET